MKEEKEKLYQYRESVRTHSAELRAGTRQGLPTDLAQPMSVGQRVVAIHQKNREVENGSVLTIDQCGYRIQFDGPELRVEFVLVDTIFCVHSSYSILPFSLCLKITI